MHLHAFMAPTSRRDSLHERLYSSLGGFFGVLAVAVISHHWAPPESAWLMTASIGASAVLLFAAPHGSMSQPWPVFGSHLVSALVGITLTLYLSTLLDPLILIAAAVSLSIFAMYALGCLHPPGGATALTVVFAAQSHQMGEINYDFLLYPLSVNLLILLATGVLFHSFSHKRYPIYLASNHFKKNADSLPIVRPELSYEDFLSALAKIDNFVDINEQEVKRILELTHLWEPAPPIAPEELKVGAYYSNGAVGKNWSVRQIVELVEDDFNVGEKEFVIFVRKAGQEKVRTDCMRRSEFARWAAYEVEPATSGWQKKTPQESDV
ncbi:HPP family protein [Thiomicrorhabdus sp. 6S3-12]|uniref:HPP family protein n=1 Tax=Thiomicrorhabdus sp. 6S3-12 TaxID=2819681 RepID=UPI001AAD6F62|nr:HPP family protein [Thiomicrorhabdus sp. 6S3-12]MBO1925053.1 HPP family protein [Thiomicrorhabdus sp. 6S3-12]